MLDLDMGNFWQRISGSKRQMTPPRTVDDLLRELSSSSSSGKRRKSPPRSASELDSVIRSNPWASRFKVFLERKRMPAKVAALKFLVLTDVFEEAAEPASLPDDDDDSSSSSSSSSSSAPPPSSSSLSSALALAHDLFLSEDAPERLPLSNAALHEALRAAGLRAKNKEKGRLPPTKEEIRLVLDARSDISVRGNGLDPKFAKFLSTVDASSAVACLLSIL